MKKTIFLIFFICISVFSYAKDFKEVLSDADKLIKNKKYHSAFKLLNEFDGKNENSDIVLKKIEIATQYFVKSIMHQTFAFVDLKAGQDIDTLRRGQSTYEMYVFPINEILEKLIKKHPNDGKLYRTLGDYYFEVYKIYKDQWIYEVDKLIDKIETNYMAAKKLNYLDYVSLDNMGVIMLIKKKQDEAENYFLQSIKANDKYGNSHYNLAYSYFIRKKNKEALTYAIKSYELYTDTYYKADAAYITGVIYETLKENANALKYYKLAQTLNKNSFIILKSILTLTLKMGAVKEGNTYAEMIFKLSPQDIKICRELLIAYGDLGYKKELLDLFDNIEKNYKSDNIVCGNLYYNRALYYVHYVKNDEEKRKNLIKARALFEKVYPKEHKVFEIIDDELKKEK